MDVREDYAHHEFINMVAIPPDGPAVVSGHNANMEAAAEGLYRLLIFFLKIVYVYCLTNWLLYCSLDKPN